MGKGYLKKKVFSTQNFENALEDGINSYKQVNNVAVKISKAVDNTGRFLHFPSFFPLWNEHYNHILWKQNTFLAPLP